jgi:hypothetical protein
VEGFFARQRAAARGSQQRALERAAPGAAAPPAPGRGGGERGRSAEWAAGCAALDKERKKQTGELRVLLDDAGRIRPDLAGAPRTWPAARAPRRPGRLGGVVQEAFSAGCAVEDVQRTCSGVLCVHGQPGQRAAVRLFPYVQARRPPLP